MPLPRVTFPLRVLALGAVVVLAGVGCSDDRSEAGPGPGDPLPADVDVGQDAPVDLSYVCGNRFLVSNAYSVPISVTYRVAGSSEEGRVEVPAAPPEDPAVSEAYIEARTAGTVQILQDGTALVARTNGGIPCTPAPSGPTFLTAGAGAGESGQWTAPFSWPIVAIHMMLLPSGGDRSQPGSPGLELDGVDGICATAPEPHGAPDR